MAAGSSTDQVYGFLFPGQGSQLVGMGKDLAASSSAARHVFEEADDILGRALSELCFDGPADQLEDTANAQPAILATSIATLEALRDAGALPTPAVVAGHSLGEFTATVAAGVMDFPTALRLVAERGELMRQAGRERPGGMAAILGMDDADAERICDEASDLGIIGVANLNCPGQIVISGENQALERAMALATDAGARKVVRLPVSIASHSPLMETVSLRLAELLATATLATPTVPVISNITGGPLTTVDEVRHELAMGVQRPVDWTASVRRMLDDGVTTFVEIGPGNVLAGLVKRIDRSTPTVAGERLLETAT